MKELLKGMDATDRGLLIIIAVWALALGVSGIGETTGLTVDQCLQLQQKAKP